MELASANSADDASPWASLIKSEPFHPHEEPLIIAANKRAMWLTEA